MRSGMIDRDIDALMDACCEGLWSLDPRTTFPFWDYDMAPLLSEPWMSGVLTAIKRLELHPGQSASLIELLSGPSVPRKELLYSLFDMKVARLPRAKRMAVVQFWIQLLKRWCGPDWLSRGRNCVLDEPAIEDWSQGSGWTVASVRDGRALGELTVALNALAYSLFSDVFVHQCAECRGPYDVLIDGNASRQTLLVRVWRDLLPLELWPSYSGAGPRCVEVRSVYRDVRFVVDIYNHVSWQSVIAPPQLTAFQLLIDGQVASMDAAQIHALAVRIGAEARVQHEKYLGLNFEEKKSLWMRQRLWQFRRLSDLVGEAWHYPGLDAAVRERTLATDPYWNMELDKESLWAFWKRCLDPRVDFFYEDWLPLFDQFFPSVRESNRRYSDVENRGQ